MTTNYTTSWSTNPVRPIHTLTRTPGARFIGVTRTGRELKCTVCSDGSFFTDSAEVCLIVGWKPIK